MKWGRDDCELCLGHGHIVEIDRVVGNEFVAELRPFDLETEQFPDDGEVWICPNCFWADDDPLLRRSS